MVVHSGAGPASDAAAAAARPAEADLASRALARRLAGGNPGGASGAATPFIGAMAFGRRRMNGAGGYRVVLYYQESESRMKDNIKEC